MFQINTIHHVSLVVASTEDALDFYVNVLGLKQDPQRPDLGFPGAWLSIGEQQIHLLEVPNPDPTEGRPEHGGRDRHLAFLVSELESLTPQLEARGIPYTRSQSGRNALFCRDPDQNAIELIEQPTVSL